jgi:nitrate reductase gamma subunit
MMESMLEWARGPAFVCCFGFMVLGYIRHLVLTVLEIRRHLARAGDKNLPVSAIVTATVKWLIPVEKIKDQFFFSVTSILFHVAILVVPLFLMGHIALWTRGLGIGWPGISNEVADALTIIAVITAVALVLQRAASRATRSLSRFQDFAIPILVAIPFATGFFVMHPWLSPFSFDAALLLHVLSANLLFVLMPITKLSHAVLLPTVQLVSEVAWHWPQDSGSQVAIALNKEEEPV